jgi:hypothetical protein
LRNMTAFCVSIRQPKTHEMMGNSSGFFSR